MKKPPEPPASIDDSSGDDYFLEIESAFANLRGTPFVFSSKDWALMKGWRDEGVPIAVVLEAMDSCFRKIEEGKRRKTISSLSYCRHAVREIWEDRRDLQIGVRGGVPEADSSSGLDRLAADLRAVAESAESEPLRVLLESAAASVLDAGRGAGVPVIEERLLSIEETLYQSLWQTLPDPVRDEIEREIARRLGLSASTEDAGLERAISANRRSILRSRFRVPTLSLFA